MNTSVRRTTRVGGVKFVVPEGVLHLFGSTIMGDFQRIVLREFQGGNTGPTDKVAGGVRLKSVSPYFRKHFRVE